MALAACGGKPAPPSTQYGANPQLPPQHQYLLPPMHIAPVAKWRPGETPHAPPGFAVTALASGLSHPRQVYGLPNGDVLVVETGGPKAPINRPKDFVMGFIQGFAGKNGKAPNRILLLRDTNGDGVADQQSVFIDHLTSPFGVALVGNDLYVADTDALLRFPYTPGQTRITATPQLVTPLPGGPIDHHWTKSLVASLDGAKLYVGVGSNSNITENGLEAEKDRAAIWEIDRATGLKRIYASGLRNPAGLAIQPGTSQLYAVVNERDELGPNLVPDYLTSVKENAFYGWPFSYYGQHVDPRVKPQRPDLVARAIPPDYALSSHVAPLGVTFADGSSLPAAFRNGAIVGEHGSWDRKPFNGYKVVFIPFAGGRPAGAPQDVLTGFLTPDGHARGRPVGVALDRAGALLVADDLGGVVWRVTAAPPGPASAAAPVADRRG